MNDNVVTEYGGFEITKNDNGYFQFTSGGVTHARSDLLALVRHIDTITEPEPLLKAGTKLELKADALSPATMLLIETVAKNVAKEIVEHCIANVADKSAPDPQDKPIELIAFEAGWQAREQYRDMDYFGHHGTPQLIKLRKSEFQKWVKGFDGATNKPSDDAELLDWLETAAKKSRTGISFDWVPAVEDEPSGFRFMRHHLIGDSRKSIRSAIRAARETIEGKGHK